MYNIGRFRTGREAVYYTCKSVLEDGRLSAPRGQMTREILGAVLQIDNPQDVLPTRINRQKLHPAIGAAEALQNIGGVSSPQLMHEISKFFPKPSARWDEDVPTYGARLNDHDQLGAVVRKLGEDPDSRQAVALIWRPDDPEAGQAHNLCTIGLQFMLRPDPENDDRRRLHMFAHMRSNDAWYGLCYDLFQFAQIQLSIANCLDVGVGPYIHTANSMHLYERHFEVASELGWRDIEELETTTDDCIWGIGRRGEEWDDVRRRAIAILGGMNVEGATESEEWFQERLRKYEPRSEWLRLEESVEEGMPA